jgi:hypothetical protein
VNHAVLNASKCSGSRSTLESPDGNLTPRDIEELITVTSEAQAKVAYSTLLLRLEENALQKKVEEIPKIQQKLQH